MGHQQENWRQSKAGVLEHVPVIRNYPPRHGRAKARRKTGVNALLFAAIHVLLSRS